MSGGRDLLMNITIVSYENLPNWVNRAFLSSNGAGKENANYILIEDGDYKECYSDAMEPEDCRFTRDLSWIVGEIQRAGQKRSSGRLTYGTNHGVDCQKVSHATHTRGWQHASDDDSPYFVDNVKYCGRCHQAL